MTEARCVDPVLWRGRSLMPTHQSLSGATDDELPPAHRADASSASGEPFWEFFAAQVAPGMPAEPVVIDLGCGPGLLLRDLGERRPDAMLHGYDVTPAMITYGRRLVFKPASVSLTVHDVTRDPLPLRRRAAWTSSACPPCCTCSTSRCRRSPRSGRVLAPAGLSPERLDSPAAVGLPGVATRRSEGERGGRQPPRLQPLPRAQQVHERGLALAPRRGGLHRQVGDTTQGVPPDHG